MKSIIGLLLASVVLLGGVAAYAGDGCCGGGAAKAGGGQCTAGGGALSQLNLTDSQKAKVAALHTEMSKATSTSEAKDMFMKGMKDILTPEQFTQFQTECQKMNKAGGGCPALKGETKS